MILCNYPIGNWKQEIRYCNQPATHVSPHPMLLGVPHTKHICELHYNLIFNRLQNMEG